MMEPQTVEDLRKSEEIKYTYWIAPAAPQYAWPLSPALCNEEDFEVLLRQYSANTRYYHTLEHIKQCINALAQFRRLAEDVAALHWAIWFHDCIYKPGCSDNEDISALCARAAMRRSGLPEAFGDKVVELIRDTAHVDYPRTSDGRLLCDIDLLPLAAGQRQYWMNADNIRQEFLDTPDRIFNLGRISFLERLLHRNSIYLTAGVFGRYETQARQNIQMEIDTLRERLVC